MLYDWHKQHMRRHCKINGVSSCSQFMWRKRRLLNSHYIYIYIYIHTVRNRSWKCKDSHSSKTYHIIFTLHCSWPDLEVEVMAVELQARRLPRQQPTLKTAFQLWYDALFVFKKKTDNLDRKSGHFQLRNRLFLTRHRDNVPLCLYWQKPYILDKIIFFLSLTKGASCLNLKSGGCCSRPLVFFF